ncbi:MAG: ATP-binding protein [Bacteroidota bacterium]
MSDRSVRIARPLIVFYVLVAYVLLQLGWWAYLLYDLNQQNFLQDLEINRLEADQFGEPLRNHAVLEEMRQKRIWMIVGEGSVFVLLLLSGIYIVQRSFRREFAVARQQENFLLSVTHELKSPLASMKLFLQTLGRRSVKEPVRTQLVTDALRESNRLEELVENILLATRIDSRKFSLHRELMDFSAFVTEFVAHRNNRPDAVRTIHLEATPDVCINADSLAMQSILTNLVENAEKYSPKEQPVTIRLERDQQVATLAVIDQGPGLQEAEKSRVFEKFYRSGNEHTRETKGTGLGLYITRFLVRAHEGSISIKNNQPHGSIFEVAMPTA